MPRILIAGCGYVGQAAADLFHERGWEVEGWTASARFGGQTCRPSRIAVRAVDITDRGRGLGRSAGSSMSSFIARVRAAVMRKSIGGFIWRERGTFSTLFRARAAFHQQHERLRPTEMGRGGRDESGRILLTKRDAFCGRPKSSFLSRDGIVARLAGIYGPGRSFLLRTFLAGEAVIDRGERSLHQPGASRRHRVRLFLLAESGLISEARFTMWWMISRSWRATLTEWLSAHLQRPSADGKARRREETRRQQQASIATRNCALSDGSRVTRIFDAAMTKSVLPSFGFERRSSHAEAGMEAA